MIPVNPGERYIIGVGNNALNNIGGVNSFSNGYYNGGSSTYDLYSTIYGGGGGAASIVFLISSPTPTTSLQTVTNTTAIIIAGGG